jgi:hypothetical protein
MDRLLDAAEQRPLREEEPDGQEAERLPGQIRRLNPIPRFTLRPKDE